MRRRDFITLTGGVAAWPLVARAQQPTANVPIVTFLNARKADAGATAVAADFRRGLSQTGLTENKDVIVEYHWLDGHYEDIPAILNDAVETPRRGHSYAGQQSASLAAKAATSTIPIVFGVGQDPVALGLVASLAQPGGNVTGINSRERQNLTGTPTGIGPIAPGIEAFTITIRRRCGTNLNGHWLPFCRSSFARPVRILRAAECVGRIAASNGRLPEAIEENQEQK